MINVPNLLSLFRIAMVPVLLGLALGGHRAAFLAVLACSLASDVADGWVARRFGRCTPLGARLDSWGDLLTWATLAPGVWLLWPAEVLAEWPTIGLAIGAFVLPTAVGFARFGALTSYHTWGAKASALLMGPGVITLLAFGEPLLFRIATGVLVLSAVEEIAISLHLRAPRQNVRSLWHVRAERRGDATLASAAQPSAKS